MKRLAVSVFIAIMVAGVLFSGLSAQKASGYTQCSPSSSCKLSQPMAVHVFNPSCQTLAVPEGTNKIEAAFTSTDQVGRQNFFAIHFVASDINHGYLYDIQIIQKGATHLFGVTLWQNGRLLSNATYPFHSGEVPLPNRPFQTADTLAFYIGPYRALEAFWYGPSGGTVHILGGANGGSAPADFGATDLTQFWGAINSRGFVTFHNLDVNMQGIGETPGVANRVPVTATKADSSILPCATGIIPITSNMCEQLMLLITNSGDQFPTTAEVCMDAV